METQGKVVISRLKGFIPATLGSIILFLVQWWAQMKGFITQDNADIIIYIAIGIFIFGLLYMLWPWLKKLPSEIRTFLVNIPRMRFRSPIYVPPRIIITVSGVIEAVDYKTENERLQKQIEELQNKLDPQQDNKREVSSNPIKNKPSTLVHDNVLWEDEGDYWGGGGIIVNGPLCPKDYAVLMMEHYDKIKQLENDKLISKEDFHYRLYCPECKSKYILGDPPKSTSDSLAEVRNRFQGVRKRSQIT